mmetsp:Transcript_51971/g.103434  ORF Transcript_51971/g.103434 Transcript_51971/m.103434 type:complete len:212 (+) Transcript_51971:604-1239(+)
MLAQLLDALGSERRGHRSSFEHLPIDDPITPPVRAEFLRCGDSLRNGRLEKLVENGHELEGKGVRVLQRARVVRCDLRVKGLLGVHGRITRRPRRLLGNHFVNEDAESPVIHASLVSCPAHLLRCEVGVVTNQIEELVIVVIVALRSRPEVNQSRVPEVVEHDRLGVDVAVDDVLSVQELDAEEDVGGVEEGRRLIERSVLRHAIMHVHCG